MRSLGKEEDNKILNGMKENEVRGLKRLVTERGVR